jgi:UPF0148 protein
LKNIGELLRKGATMLSESCPACNTPIFKLKDGSLYCAMCEKQVVVVPADTDAEALERQNILEDTLNRKIKQVQDQLDEEMDLDKINALLETLQKLIDTQSKLKSS